MDKPIRPADVKTHPELQALAQDLCDKDNNIDGILILCPKAPENPFFLDVYTPSKIQGIDTEAFGGNLLAVLKTAEDLIVSNVSQSTSFNTGDIKTIFYEFDSFLFVIYSVRGEKESLQGVYLVLVNATSKDLGAFNANRGLVRAQMEVAIKKSGLI